METIFFTENNFDELTSKYGKWGSWAIWNEDKSAPDFKKKLTELHSRYVIIGLNPSGKIENPDGIYWRNFHGGKNDGKLHQAFNDTKVKGAYMTDLIKKVESNANKTRKYIDDPSNSENIEIHKKNFQDELNAVDVTTKSTFILLGKDVKNLFDSFVNEEFRSNKRIDLPHYAFRFTMNYYHKKWEDIAKEAIKDL